MMQTIDPDVPPKRGYVEFVPGNALSRGLGVALVLLAVCSAIVTFSASSEQARIASCQQAYNEAFTEALTVRNEIAVQDRLALIGLTNALLDPKATREEKAKAFYDYNATLRSSETKRQVNPLPTPKDCSSS